MGFTATFPSGQVESDSRAELSTTEVEQTP